MTIVRTFQMAAVAFGCVLGTGTAVAQDWPEDARNISRGDFEVFSGGHFTCGVYSGDAIFNDIDRQYYFEGTVRGSDGMEGIMHSSTFDQGTIIAQGYSFRGVNRGAAFLRREYVMDDGVDFPQFVGDSVSIPMKVSRDGQTLYPGTFKDDNDVFKIAILECNRVGDTKPSWAR